ncbi:DUF6221 family protein [Streptosporangium sp. CA-135522]|uniref:DUF6221 family protein n=1 Tax=Streptosporangium sp. CA-135522 TaxID=3240072 RepID=UPI003D91FCE5
MDGLIAFLRARWGEEEADARLASAVYGKSWWWNPAFGLVKGDPDDSEATSIFSLGEETVAEVWSEVGPHIARHDPARVLRDIEAKWRMLELAQDMLASPIEPGAGQDLRLFALPYADHSDYQPEWKP